MMLKIFILMNIFNIITINLLSGIILAVIQVWPEFSGFFE
jgi:hypothetical protein